MQRNFKIDWAESESPEYKNQWDAFWARRYPGWRVEREVDVRYQKLGIDVLLHGPRGQCVQIDEKISDNRYPDTYPIEILSVMETRKLGWALAHSGMVAMVKVDKPRRLFTSKPILFELNSKFRVRVANNEIFPTRPADNGNYHTLNRIVPEHALRHFENDWYWEENFTRIKPLSEFM